ncbi:MarR family winged helix-turn-helix transcriptional regulator [Micrococcaceae bacterium Sec5.7]
MTAREAPMCQQLFLPQFLNAAFERMMSDLHAHLTAHGYDDMRPTHFMNVFRFMDCDGTRPAELARRAGMTPQAMGELVSQLEKRGYVKRVADPGDGRSRTVVWAERGQAAADVANAFFEELDHDWATAVGQDDLNSMKQALRVLVAQPPRQSPPPWPPTEGTMFADVRSAGKA